MWKAGTDGSKFLLLCSPYRLIGRQTSWHTYSGVCMHDAAINVVNHASLHPPTPASSLSSLPSPQPPTPASSFSSLPSPQLPTPTSSLSSLPSPQLPTPASSLSSLPSPQLPTPASSLSSLPSPQLLHQYPSATNAGYNSPPIPIDDK